MSDAVESHDRSDKKRIARNAAIARLSKFIDTHLHKIDWTLLAEMAGVGHILDEPHHERVRRAQYFGDPDYPSAVSRFLQEVFDWDEQSGLLIVSEISQQEDSNGDSLSQDAKARLTQILSLFDAEGLEYVAGSKLAPIETGKFIDVVWMPDDFYQKLIDEVNRAYAYRMPIALSITIRKLLENLVIDVLRKKYGTAGLTLYYDTSRRRFHDFSVLLKNLEANQGDFHHISPSLDRTFIDELNRHRETGNSGAHSIDANLAVEQFIADKGRINYLVHLLLRIFQRL